MADRLRTIEEDMQYVEEHIDKLDVLDQEIYRLAVVRFEKAKKANKHEDIIYHGYFIYYIYTRVRFLNLDY